MASGEMFRGEERQSAPVTLPKLPCLETPPVDDDGGRFAEQRTIRAGLDAWQTIGKADSFENWKAIGAALAIGKAHALRVTGANAAWGRNYSRAFGDWIKAHRFDKMAKSVRSVAIELHEHAAEVERWRATLTEKQRKRLVHPLSNVRRWRQATQTKTTGDADDALKAAEVAWRRFVSCMAALPPDQAAPFWQAVQAQAAALAKDAEFTLSP